MFHIEKYRRKASYSLFDIWIHTFRLVLRPSFWPLLLATFKIMVRSYFGQAREKIRAHIFSGLLFFARSTTFCWESAHEKGRRNKGPEKGAFSDPVQLFQLSDSLSRKGLQGCQVIRKEILFSFDNSNQILLGFSFFGGKRHGWKERLEGPKRPGNHEISGEAARVCIALTEEKNTGWQKIEMFIFLAPQVDLFLKFHYSRRIASSLTYKQI